MIIYHPRPTYEKEYHEAVAKRDERITVYEDYCVGDIVYYRGVSKAVVWKDNSIFNFYIIFENSYHSRIVDKKYVKKTISLKEDSNFEFLY